MPRLVLAVFALQRCCSAWNTRSAFSSAEGNADAFLKRSATAARGCSASPVTFSTGALAAAAAFRTSLATAATAQHLVCSTALQQLRRPAMQLHFAAPSKCCSAHSTVQRFAAVMICFGHFQWPQERRTRQMTATRPHHTATYGHAASSAAAVRTGGVSWLACTAVMWRSRVDAFCATPTHAPGSPPRLCTARASP